MNTDSAYTATCVNQSNKMILAKSDLISTVTAMCTPLGIKRETFDFEIKYWSTPHWPL